MSETDATEEPKLGFGHLPCPMCHGEGAIAVYLDDLSSFYCAECGDGFEMEDVKQYISQRIDKWKKILDWLESGPRQNED